MAERKMIIEYIRKGYPGKRIVKDGIEFVQKSRGPRIGVFVALNGKQFGWSLVHLKGENKEPAKNISWKKGVEIAVARAEGKSSEKVPDSIKRQYETFCKRISRIFDEKVIPVEGIADMVIIVRGEGENKEYIIRFPGNGTIFAGKDDFARLLTVMHRAMKPENN